MCEFGPDFECHSSIGIGMPDALPVFMKHLTLTGVEAGKPFCGVDKQKALQKGDTFSHLPYSKLEEFLKLPEICPSCLKVWEDSK